MRIIIVILAVLSTVSCVSKQATLVNDQGQEVVCDASGFGIISGTMAKNEFNRCVSDAQTKGFKVRTPSQSR
jgi:uncharacterized protein YcfL